MTLKSGDREGIRALLEQLPTERVQKHLELARGVVNGGPERDRLNAFRQRMNTMHGVMSALVGEDFKEVTQESIERHAAVVAEVAEEIMKGRRN